MMACKQPKGPEPVSRVFNVRPENANIFVCVMSSQYDEVKRLLVCGEVSVADVNVVGSGPLRIRAPDDIRLNESGLAARSHLITINLISLGYYCAMCDTKPQNSFNQYVPFGII